MYTFEYVKEDKEKKLRYEAMFGFNNILLVFRKKRICLNNQIIEKNTCVSEDYQIIYSSYEINNSVKDILSIMLCDQAVGQIKMEYGDVICLKINNKMLSFRCNFSGRPLIDDLNICFLEVSDFLTKEREDVLLRFRSTNKIYDVFTQTEHSISSINLKKYLFITLNTEVFYPEGDKETIIVSDYSVYQFFDMKVKKINPYKQPFFDYNSAIEYLNMLKKKTKKANVILLYNLSEMYWLRDYFQLLKLA